MVLNGHGWTDGRTDTHSLFIVYILFGGFFEIPDATTKPG